MVSFAYSLALLVVPISTVIAVHKGHNDNIKTFFPVLKNPPSFNVYSKPIKVSAATLASVTGAGAADSPPSEEKGMQDKTQVAVAYLSKVHDIPTGGIKITDAYTDSRNGITYVHAQQVVGGLEISNSLANVNIDCKGRVISSSQSFASQTLLGKIKRSASAFAKRSDNEGAVKSALKSLADYVNTSIDDHLLENTTIASVSGISSDETSSHYTISNIPLHAAEKGSSTAKKSYIQTEDGEITPVWHLVLPQEGHWWSAHVNEDTGKVESINDWVSNAESYKVFPRNVNTPADGCRQVVASPANSEASPKGWATRGTTVGNNVWAQNNPTGGNSFKSNHRPNSTTGAFSFPLDLTNSPRSYVDASIAQLFYTVNTMHDLSYLYGFDEAAGNFQDVNFSGKGKGGDGIIANAQDGSGTDNANFATPPDGQRGRMRMYVWTQEAPSRDASLEQDIVAHEFTHGISNRLTGGPANADCLNSGEAGGMGEGWSDTIANLLRITPNMTRETDLIMAEYAAGEGIRRFPYSTSLTTNPETFAYLDRSNYQEVHAIGEVWASMLYEMIWNLIDANGISDDLFKHDLTMGNSMAFQIILDGMKLQPCNPTFITARNAILHAEKNLTGGKNQCAIWKAFAKRGAGPNATGGNRLTHVEDYSVPSDC